MVVSDNSTALTRYNNDELSAVAADSGLGDAFSACFSVMRCGRALFPRARGQGRATLPSATIFPFSSSRRMEIRSNHASFSRCQII